MNHLAEIERVAGISDNAFVAAARVLAAAVVDVESLWFRGELLRVGQLREAIGICFLEAGLRQPEGNLISTGANAAEPHHVGHDLAEIRASDAVVVDLFPKGELYSDCTRTFCIKAGPELVGAAELVARVKHAAVAHLERCIVAEGRADGFAVHQVACREFSEAGWPTQLDRVPDNDAEADSGEGVSKRFAMKRGFVHGLGHGVGLELHQAPRFFFESSGTDEGTISEGDVITIEPGLYEPGRFGVRYEDLYVVEKSGLRRLTRLPWELDPKRFLAGLAQ